jgi:peptide/nickel transport system permease protein
MTALKRTLRDLARYPSAIAGLVIILSFVGVALYTIIAIPYNEAIRLWRGGEDVWYNLPKTAWPVWYNWITGRNLPSTIDLDSRVEEGTKTTTVMSEDMTDVTILFSFDYPYDDFPQELSLYIYPEYEEKPPFVSMTWIMPDGREMRVGEVTPQGESTTFIFGQDERLLRRLRGMNPTQGLFVDPTLDVPVLIRGTYQFRISAVVFEENSDVDAQFILFGKVHGAAGTDYRRRDLMIPLLWGTPIALAFGLVAALGTSITTMTIAATGTWYGRWLDTIIQRITEVNLILPLLPILIMVGTFYDRSIWLMLGLVIAFGIFGAAIKTYRAIFLQIKESPYVEAARSYGAGNARIIFRYLIPRIIPLLIPGLVTQVPAFVFLEAALAVLGLGDPVLPTWGKVINEAQSNGALFNGYYYWVLEPAILLMLVGLGFAMLGFALDRVFNPRLRGL